MNDRSLEPNPEAVQDIFSDACDFSLDQREAILNDRCGGDTRLRTAVLDLLTASDRAGRFMSDPVAAVERSATGAPLAMQLPSQIDEFKIIRLLGEGGFGSVYLAEQEHPVRREVALKVIKLGMDTAQVIARFEAERQALAMMDHPNIAKVFDAGATQAGRPYFVMELVNGVPITEYCDAHRLTIRKRLELFIPVCLAVGHAHQKGVIHRDIKPSNVLVAVHDGKPVPKVIDFGVAKATGLGLAEQTGLTNLRPMIGTLEYMSPEQADSDRDVDTRSDVYSLGVLLYELLTGKTPFNSRELRAKGYSEAQRALREVEPPRPSAGVNTPAESASTSADRRATDPRRLAGLLRGDLDWVVMRCLEKDRGRRYQTAVALADDIKHSLNHEPVTAGPATASYRARLRFKLFRWSQKPDGESAELLSEGTLKELQLLDEPPPGLYLLGLEVPRLGDEPLRRACWLLVAPWTVEVRPIPRFDVARSMPSDTNLERIIATSGPSTQRTANALAMDDGLALTTGQAARLNWFTVRATTHVSLAQGMYRISASADDGVRIWVDGRLAIDAWYPQSCTTKDGVLELDAGEHDLKVEYFQQVGGYSLWVQFAPMTWQAKAAALALGGGVPQLDSQIIRLRQEMSEFPADRSLRALHARAMARRGRFAQSMTEFAEVSRLDPMNHQFAYLRATLLAYQENQQEYAKVCQGMLNRFSTSKDALARENLIKACCLGTDLPVDKSSFRALLDQTAKPESTVRLACGLAHYRVGQFDLAAEELRGGAAGWSNEQPTTQATARLFLAMSLQRLGRGQEAFAEYEAGRHIMQADIPTADVEDLDAVGVENWLTCQIA